MDDREIAMQKSVAFYAASVAAWYASALEHSRSLFAVSAAGTGLIVTLLATVGAHDWLTFSLFALAMASLLVTQVCVLLLFRHHKPWIEGAAASASAEPTQALQRLERVALVAFATGVFLAAGAGISAAWHAWQAKDAAAARGAADHQEPAASSGGGAATRLQPEFTRSFQGAAPAASSPATAAPGGTTGPSAPKKASAGASRPARP